jgi:hypothetical protein
MQLLLWTLVVGPSPADLQRVNAALIRRLGSDEVAVRQKAADDVLKLYYGERLAYSLCADARYVHPDPEVRSQGARAYAFLQQRRWHRDLPDIKDCPCIDCMWYDLRARRYDSSLPAYAMLGDYLRLAGDPDSPFPRPAVTRPDYREATILWLCELSDAGVPLPLQRLLVYYMRWRDRQAGVK